MDHKSLNQVDSYKLLFEDFYRYESYISSLTYHLYKTGKIFMHKSCMGPLQMKVDLKKYKKTIPLTKGKKLSVLQTTRQYASLKPRKLSVLQTTRQYASLKPRKLSVLQTTQQYSSLKPRKLSVLQTTRQYASLKPRKLSVLQTTRQYASLKPRKLSVLQTTPSKIYTCIKCTM